MILRPKMPAVREGKKANDDNAEHNHEKQRQEKGRGNKGKKKRNERTRRNGKKWQKKQKEGGTKQQLGKQNKRGKAPKTRGTPTHAPDH